LTAPDLHSAWVAANEYANALHDLAMLLGYNVGASVAGNLGSEADEVSFWVRPVDQPSGTEQTFSTTGEVDEYLAHLASLPRCCLELEGNRRIVSGLRGAAASHVAANSPR